MFSDVQKRRSGKLLLWGVTIMFVVAGCSTVPYTGRRAFNLVPDSQADSLGSQAYEQVRQKNKMITSGPEYDQVVRVGKRIAAVANQPDFQWEFSLIDDPKTANAFCLPGGKVAVYSGILPITRNDEGMATVLAHETAHAVARHGSERLTDQLALNIAGVGLQQLLQTRSPMTQQVAMAAFGAGTTLGLVLPFSRSQESEADHIGLILMAKAGYDPQGAVAFWNRMAAASKGGAPPQFLSDHPSDVNRIQQLQKWMPEAEKYYNSR